MQRASVEELEAVKGYGSATMFNAYVASLGGSQGGLELEGKGGVPENYTGPEIRCLLPELGTAVGYAVTAELTTNDPDSEDLGWDGYYELMERIGPPIVAVMRDVDTRPGRGACFGDGMAGGHKALGATGALVDGSVRDVAGIKEVGLPVWGTGVVPGHGVFNVVRFNSSVTVARLRIHPGDLVVADGDGCTTIPAGLDLGAIIEKAREIDEREQEWHAMYRAPGFTLAKRKELRERMAKRR